MIKNQFPRWVKINFQGGKKLISTVVKKINFHGGKNQLFPLRHTQISVQSTRARVTLSFDWLAFAVKLVFVGSCSRKIARAYLIGWCGLAARV